MDDCRIDMLCQHFNISPLVALKKACGECLDMIKAVHSSRFMFIEGNQARFSTQLPSCHQEERRRLEEERLRLEEEERLREEEETRLQKEGGFPGSQ